MSESWRRTDDGQPELWRVGHEVLRVLTLSEGGWCIERLQRNGSWTKVADDKTPEDEYDDFVEILLCVR